MKYWAAYSGSALHSALSLHRTEREALDAIAEAFWGDQPDDTQHPEQTNEELREAIQDHCNSSADDWEVSEVEAPE